MELSREQRKLNMIDNNQDFDCGKFTILELLKVPDEKK
jgi:predicted double-glycine peptidase